MSQDKRAVAAIRPLYEKYQKALDTEAEVGVPDDVFWGAIPYFPYLTAAGALFKITGSPVERIEQKDGSFVVDENVWSGWLLFW